MAKMCATADPKCRLFFFSQKPKRGKNAQQHISIFVCLYPYETGCARFVLSLPICVMNP